MHDDPWSLHLGGSAMVRLVDRIRRMKCSCIVILCRRVYSLLPALVPSPLQLWVLSRSGDFVLARNYLK
jgi:hypothetical protein